MNDITTVSVETRILGWGAETITVPLPSANLRVADLIRAKITVEWERRQRGERKDVGRESAEPDAIRWWPAPADSAGTETLEEAVRSATDAYRAGWYVVLVDGEEPGGLDSRLTLSSSSVVAFVRIYPLPDSPRGE